MKTLCSVSLPILMFSLAMSAQADSFTYDGILQTYTVATTGIYDIVAFGAQGGTNGFNTFGGAGAEIGGNFTLNAGDVLDFFVGGQGFTGHDAGDGGGGGGGTFVYDATTSTLLLVAGGGGGGSISSGNGGPGLTGTAGGNGISGGAGGAAGLGGAAGGGTDGGGGGGGYSTVGGDAIPQDGALGHGGGDFLNLAGGIGHANVNGGYGGGGGAGADGAGGGGGYGGGGGGNGHHTSPNFGAGGGGGSFNGSLTNVVAVSGENTGNGLATIGLQAAATPEPASFVLALLSLLAIPVYRRWRRPQAE